MKTKPYIKCPLEAALAAKNFGFKFKDENNRTMKWAKREGLIVMGCNGWNEVSLNDSRTKYYIAAESLPLLEPMVGDIIFGRAVVSWSGTKYDYCDRIEEIDDQCYTLQSGPEITRGEYLDDGDESFRIIQRNNKPFPEIHYEN